MLRRRTHPGARACAGADPGRWHERTTSRHRRRIADYRIEGLLGRGAMAVVYEATQLSLDRRVALKVLPSESASSPRTSSSAHAPHAYLADFGLVRPLENGSLTCSGATLGTLGYLAPEQLRGGAPSPAADIYALAVVLHECLGRIDASPA